MGVVVAADADDVATRHRQRRFELDVGHVQGRAGKDWSGDAAGPEPLNQRHGTLASIDLVGGKGGGLLAVGADEAELAAVLVDECGDAHGDRLLAVWKLEGRDASFGDGETWCRA